VFELGVERFHRLGEQVEDDLGDVFDGGVEVGELGRVFVEVFVVEPFDDGLVDDGVELGHIGCAAVRATATRAATSNL
jgi:hypothetical protein